MGGGEVGMQVEEVEEAPQWPEIQEQPVEVEDVPLEDENGMMRSQAHESTEEVRRSSPM